MTILCNLLYYLTRTFLCGGDDHDGKKAFFLVMNFWASFPWFALLLITLLQCIYPQKSPDWAEIQASWILVCVIYLPFQLIVNLLLITHKSSDQKGS